MQLILVHCIFCRYSRISVKMKDFTYTVYINIPKCKESLNLGILCCKVYYKQTTLFSIYMQIILAKIRNISENSEKTFMYFFIDIRNTCTRNEKTP